MPTRHSSNTTELKRFCALYDAEQWPRAEKLLRRMLVREPQSGWLWSRLSSVVYEQHRYREALTFAKKALRLQPTDPLFRWDYAGALWALGRFEEAASEYRRLIRRGPALAGTVDCGEGVRWASELINDCRFCLAECHDALGKRRLAARWFREYMEQRRAGVRGCLTIREAQARMRQGGSRGSRD